MCVVQGRGGREEHAAPKDDRQPPPQDEEEDDEEGEGDEDDDESDGDDKVRVYTYIRGSVDRQMCGTVCDGIRAGTHQGLWTDGCV